MRNLMTCLLMLSLLFMVSACKGSKNGLSDSDITSNVRAKLESDPTIPAADIDVHTDDGVVTLSGKVIGQSTADRAMQLARSAQGVRGVNSTLKVNTYLTNKDVHERVEQGEDTAKEENKASKEAGKQASNGNMSDASITAQVKNKLEQDQMVGALNIEVTTDNRVVTLRGAVNQDSEAKRAVQLAQSVPDVKQVKSDLQVASDIQVNQ